MKQNERDLDVHPVNSANPYHFIFFPRHTSTNPWNSAETLYFTYAHPRGSLLWAN